MTTSENVSSFAISAPATTSIEIEGTSARFPVRRVYCIVRNYRDHAIESGDDPDKLPPFFFMKPGDAIVPDRGDFPYPPMTERVDFEIEMVVALHSGGASISKRSALQHVYGYGVGLDMTRRDLQDDAKRLSRPWEAAKSFDHSAPCSPLHPAADIGHPDKGRIWLSVNGELKQDSDISLLRWSVAESIAVLSTYFELAAGDLIYTGTPAGIGPVHRGDLIRGGVDGVDSIAVRVV
jgi:fumarylpyruvate hydrolase